MTPKPGDQASEATVGSVVQSRQDRMRSIMLLNLSSYYGVPHANTIDAVIEERKNMHYRLTKPERPSLPTAIKDPQKNCG